MLVRGHADTVPLLFSRVHGAQTKGEALERYIAIARFFQNLLHLFALWKGFHRGGQVTVGALVLGNHPANQWHESV